MESDPSIETDFFLGERLKKTLAEIHAMPLHEWVGWTVYFGRKAQREQIEQAKGKARGRK